MKSALIALLALVMASMSAQQPSSQTPDFYRRYNQAQKYVGSGFDTVDCLAGQALVGGKPLKDQVYSILRPTSDMKCCGDSVASGRTDHHGHLLVEPLEEGKYFAKFQLKGITYVAKIAVIDSYKRCDGSFVTLDFSSPDQVKVQNAVVINDSGEECSESAPECYRK